MNKNIRILIIIFQLFFLINIIINCKENAYANDKYSHGISTLKNLKYKKNFKHFDYSNPKSKKQGVVKFGVEGGFNSLNPFILKGIPASGLNYLYDSLTESSDDEISSRYGLIAEGIFLNEKEKYIEFTLRKIAKFHDGKPITADDVVFTFEKLIADGHPSYKMMYKEVLNVKKINDYLVRFNFKKNYNRDLPVMVSSLPILPKHYYQIHQFNKTTLEIPLGSGPYKIKEFSANRTLTYQRVDDYWAKDLPVNKGRYNFDLIIYDYYKDNNVLIEAFKSQKYDFRQENVARNWATAYNIQAVKDQQIIKKEIKHQLPAPAQSFVLNLRKEIFHNISFRKALNFDFDFEWLQKNIFYGSYQRTNSYFANSIFGYQDFKMPISGLNDQQKNGFNRNNLIKAQKILQDSGYYMINNQLYDPNTNKPIKIEFLIDQKSFEMIIAPFVKNLKKLGINASIKMVDENQYQSRINNFDFDIITSVFPQASLPGYEIYSYFHSSQKDIKGSRNLMGIADPIVDQIIEEIIKSRSQKDLQIYCQKLDKYLLENYYSILQWYNNSYRVLYRDIFNIPSNQPKYSLALDTWSIK